MMQTKMKSLMWDIFSCFEAISSLKVNLQKLELVAVGVLNCSITSMTLTYMRLPLGAFFKSKAIWNVAVEKMERMDSWKKIYLS
jgi:hypothetical protein